MPRQERSADGQDTLLERLPFDALIGYEGFKVRFWGSRLAQMESQEAKSGKSPEAQPQPWQRSLNFKPKPSEEDSVGVDPLQKQDVSGLLNELMLLLLGLLLFVHPGLDVWGIGFPAFWDLQREAGTNAPATQSLLSRIPHLHCSDLSSR